MSNTLVGNMEQTSINTYKEFVRLSPVSVAVLDENLNYIACSNKWKTLIDLIKEITENQSLFHSFFNTNQSFKSKCFDCLNGVIYQNQEGLFFNGSTSFRWIVYHMHPLKGDNDEIAGLVIYAEDITAKKLLLQSQKVNQNFNAIEDSSLGVVCFDLEGNCTKVNIKAKELLGYASGDFFPDFKKIIHKEDGKVLPNSMTSLLNNPKKNYMVAELRLKDATSKILNTILFISIRNDKNGKPSYFEAQLVDAYSKSSLDDFHPAFMDMEAIFKASSNIIIVLTDKNGIIREFNEGGEKILGYSKEEVIGKCSPEIFHCEQELATKCTLLSEKLGKKVSGFTVFSELANSNYQTEEWIYKRKDGTCFTVSLTLNTVKSAKGEVEGYLAVAQDISDLKNKEREVEKLLNISEKQREKLLNFTHIVSHNIKSHSSNIDMLLNDYYENTTKEAFSKTAELLSLTSEKLSETIYFLNHILNINSIPKKDLTLINLSDSVNESLVAHEKLAFDNNVSLISDINPEIFVLSTSCFLKNIINVFLENGIRYKQDAVDSFVHFKTLKKGAYVVLQIEDNGLGIDVNLHRENLFGMYKTFHMQGQTKGLGMFIAKNQIEAMGGKVDIISKVGEGTTIEIYFRYEKN